MLHYISIDEIIKKTEKIFLELLNNYSEALNADILKLGALNSDHSILNYMMKLVKSSIGEHLPLGENNTIKVDNKEIYSHIMKTKKILISNKDRCRVYIPLLATNNDVTGIIDITLSNEVDTSSVIYDSSNLKMIEFINSLYQFWYTKHRKVEDFLNVLKIIFNIRKKREPYMLKHIYNVTQLSIALGKKLLLRDDELVKLYISAILHDIGKLYINEKILNKPGRLDEYEYNLIKEHPVYSYEIINQLPTFGYDMKSVSVITKHHHERYDGNGYPDKIKGKEIPYLSRIINVADSVDAMLSERPYKKPMHHDIVIKDLKENKGKQFDPILAAIMIDILAEDNHSLENIFLNNVVNIPYLTATIFFAENILSLNKSRILKKDLKGEYRTIFFNFSFDVNNEAIEGIKKIHLLDKESNNLLNMEIKSKNNSESLLQLKNSVCG